MNFRLFKCVTFYFLFYFLESYANFGGILKATFNRYKNMSGKNEKPRKKLKKRIEESPKVTKAHKVVFEEKYNKDDKENPLAFVCLGGSAGSLLPIQTFLSSIPADTGMAFIVVQHLSPDYPPLMPELLASATLMPVAEVQDGVKALPSHVYVIPPGREMTIAKGILSLSVPSKPRGQRMPIDVFMEALAKDKEEKAIGVIFSGLDSDGVQGAKFIKANLGMIMAQSPESSQYADMPRNTIQRDFVDFIGTPSELAKKLIVYTTSAINIKIPRREQLTIEQFNDSLQNIFILLREQTGHDFSLYKMNTIHRRIERRMNTHQIHDIENYVKLLQANPDEIELLFKELLIGVTKFFRDQEAFTVLKDEILPGILREKTNGESIRLWCTGISTGEEVYSMAIIILECLSEHCSGKKIPVQIFATDIDPDAVEKARSGQYLANISLDVSEERLNRFFIKDGDFYLIKKELREMIVFATHNVLKDAPFTKLDLLCCRNLLIYLSPDLQKKLIPVFHFALGARGHLFLGPSESLGNYTELFAPINQKWKIFQKKISETVKMVDFPFSFTNHSLKGKLVKAEPTFETSTSLEQLCKNLLLESFTPPAAIVNVRGDILYIHGRTGKFLEPASGNAQLNILHMAREGLKFDLNTSLIKAASQKSDIYTEKIKVKTNGHHLMIKLSVKYINEPANYKGLLLVVFHELYEVVESEIMKAEIGEAKKRDKLIAHLEKELDHTKQELQTSLEEMESSYEELKSANEELQSTNEELQSINEESLSSKEELQSLNEELMAVNIEYQAKTDELTQMNNDMKNLLDSTEIATIFIDNKLNIKRFTPAATKIVNVIPTDIGRPLGHVVTNLKYNQLVQDVKDVLERLVPKENFVQTENGDWYAMRLSPYRTFSNYINGIVVTFTDITKLKKLEVDLQESLLYSEVIIGAAHQPSVVLNKDLEIVSCSESFGVMFKVTASPVKGKPFFEVIGEQCHIPGLEELLSQVVSEEIKDEKQIIEKEFSCFGEKTMAVRIKYLQVDRTNKRIVLLTFNEGRQI